MKTLTGFSLGLLKVVLPGTSVSAKPVPPVRNLQVDGVCWNLPFMDGVAEDLYPEVQTTTIFNPTEWENESDFTATFRLTWDPSCLYVYAEIIDDVPHIYEWGAGNAGAFDNTEKYSNISICVVQGRVLMETGYHPGQELDISALKRGLYTLVLEGQRSGRFIKHSN